MSPLRRPSFFLSFFFGGGGGALKTHVKFKKLSVVLYYYTFNFHIASGMPFFLLFHHSSVKIKLDFLSLENYFYI